MGTSVKESQLRVVASRFLRARPMIATPGSLAAMVAVYLAGVRGAQLAALVAVAVALNALFVVEHRRFSRTQVTRTGFFASLIATLGGLTLLCALTGGIESPMLPIWFAPTGVMIAALGGDRLLAPALGASFGSLALLVLVSVMALPLAPIPRPFSLVMLAGTVILSVALLAVGVGGLTEGYASLAESLDGMRRQAVADAEERSRTLDSVGARVAHEIKNPLTAIKGLVQLEQRGRPSDRSRQRLDVMASEIVRMEGILSDYLRFSRPLADVHLSDVDLSTIAEDVSQLVEASASDAGISVKTGGSSTWIRADANLLKQAVLNLAKNAIEATGTGGTITLCVGEEAGQPFIEVRDTGRGMNPTELARVDEAFYSSRDGGTGLGVTLAKTIAAQHGGDLDYTSVVGEGTRARLTLTRVTAS